MKTVACFYHDSPSQFIGLKFAIASLTQVNPTVRIVAFCPQVTEQFMKWVGRFPTVEVRRGAPENARGWNVKPYLLMDLLQEGNDEAIWFDTDLIFTGDPIALIQRFDMETFVMAEDTAAAPFQGSSIRTEAWNLPVGRVFKRTLCAGLLRATTHHIHLLRRYRELLETPAYVDMQKQPMRPLHLHGDQEVLNALLGSVEFATLPVGKLRTGKEIVHGGSPSSYTPLDRLKNIFRPPAPIIHASGAKPWAHLGPNIKPQSLSHAVFLATLETSLYLPAARKVRHLIDEPCDWLDHRTLLGQILVTTGFGNHALRGLPIAIPHRIARIVLNALGKHPSWFIPPKVNQSSL